MRYVVDVQKDGGSYTARCAAMPECVSSGATVQEAVASMRAQLLFWIESCPCDVTAESGLELEVREQR